MRPRNQICPKRISRLKTLNVTSGISSKSQCLLLAQRRNHSIDFPGTSLICDTIIRLSGQVLVCLAACRPCILCNAILSDRCTGVMKLACSFRASTSPCSVLFWGSVPRGDHLIWVKVKSMSRSGTKIVCSSRLLRSRTGEGED